MTAPPQPESRKALQAYLKATKAVNGVVQATLQHYPIPRMQRQLAHEWPLFFSETEQEAIIVQYAINRLDQ